MGILRTCSRCQRTVIGPERGYYLCYMCKRSSKIETAVKEVRAINQARLKRARERREKETLKCKN